MCPQFFQKSESHLQILGARKWHEASSALRSHSSWVTCEPHTCLVLSAWCMWTDTFVCKEETCSNCTEYVNCHNRKVRHPGDLAHGIFSCCAFWTQNTNFCLKFGIALYLGTHVQLRETRICFSEGSCFGVDHLHSIKVLGATISFVYNMVLECNPCLLYGHFTHDSVIFVNFILSDTLFELFSETWI